MMEDRLRTLLRVAESAHAAYEAERGEPDPDWPAWYAQFIVARWREEPGAATHELLLDDDEHTLLQAAVHEAGLGLRLAPATLPPPAQTSTITSNPP